MPHCATKAMTFIQAPPRQANWPDRCCHHPRCRLRQMTASDLCIISNVNGHEIDEDGLIGSTTMPQQSCFFESTF